MARSRPRAAGRKRDPEAKRRNTSGWGRERERIVGPTSELIQRRRELTGDGAISETFPLITLKEGVWITQDMFDAGWEFAQLAWVLYGRPASCEPIYRRLGTGFFTGGGRGPLVVADIERADPDARRERRFAAMLATLQNKNETRRTVIEVIKVTRDLVHPPFIAKVLANRNPSEDDARGFGRLILGLTRLAQL